MDTKKKLIISASAFVVVLVATIVAVVSVLAATKVTVNSNVNITYTANGDVLGSIAVAAKNSKGTAVGTSGSKNLTAATGATETLGSYSSLTLDNSDNKTITFTFTLTNSSPVSDYTAKLKFTPGADPVHNVKMYTGTAEASLTEITSTNFPSMASFDVNKSETKTFVVKIELNDPNDDARFIGTFAWELTSDRHPAA